MTLQQLIAARRGRRSLQELADDSGTPKQTWATHANPAEGGGRRIPEADTILAIARGLDVDPQEVVLAIGETLRVIPSGRRRPDLLAQLPPWDVLDRLTPKDIATIRNMVRLLADRPRNPIPAPAVPVAV